jgi:hypothetical protein
LVSFVSFVSLLMIGCDVSQSERDKHYFTVSFYDENLDLEGQTKVDVRNPTIDIAQLKTDLALSASSLYRGGSEDNVSGETSYSLTGDTNFYADSKNVTEITTQEGLADINATAATLSGKYILLNDIALDKSGAGFEATYGWKPMGDYSSNPFTGIFNGNGHKITGLWIDRPSMDYVGLFGFTNGAVIKNIGVEIPNGKTVKGNDHVGGIVGYVADSTITNSYAIGDVSGFQNVGGIAGGVSSGSSITNSYAAGNISGSQYVGGIAGYVSGDITNSYATGNILGNEHVGGIAGEASSGSSITNSYSTGDVSGTNSIGGIVGYVNNSSITNSYSTGNIIGDIYVGGIAGYSAFPRLPLFFS